MMCFCIVDPPSPPQILGDLRAEQRSGDRVKLTCITDGGNPLPKLSWLRNGVPLQESSMLQPESECVLEKSPKNHSLHSRRLITENASDLGEGRQISEQINVGQSRSELTLLMSPADHEATYRCRSFSENTMTRPVDSDESITFNVTCK